MREQLGDLARDAARAGRYLTQGLRLMVGVPDYGSYLAHHQATHPERPAMSYEEFFNERQAARYASRAGTCC